MKISIPYLKMFQHIGHPVEVVYYGKEEDPVNIAVECLECNEVLISFDKYEEEE